MRALLMGVLVASCVAMSAWADGADDVNAGYEAFARGDPTLAVELYTRGIESGELTKEGLAIAYSNRCAANYSLGQFEAAVAFLFNPQPGQYAPRQSGVGGSSIGGVHVSFQDLKRLRRSRWLTCGSINGQVYGADAVQPVHGAGNTARCTLIVALFDRL